MGRLTFAGGSRWDLDDRTLAHVHAVILAKLRRGESFSLTWRDSLATGDGRTTVWVHPALSVRCRLDAAPPELDRAWLHALMDTANTPEGLRLVPPTERTEGAPRGQAPV